MIHKLELFYSFVLNYNLSLIEYNSINNAYHSTCRVGKLFYFQGSI